MGAGTTPLTVLIVSGCSSFSFPSEESEDVGAREDVSTMREGSTEVEEAPETKRWVDEQGVELKGRIGWGRDRDDVPDEEDSSPASEVAVVAFAAIAARLVLGVAVEEGVGRGVDVDRWERLAKETDDGTGELREREAAGEGDAEELSFVEGGSAVVAATETALTPSYRAAVAWMVGSLE